MSVLRTSTGMAAVRRLRIRADLHPILSVIDEYIRSNGGALLLWKPNRIPVIRLASHSPPRALLCSALLCSGLLPIDKATTRKAAPNRA